MNVFLTAGPDQTPVPCRWCQGGWIAVELGGALAYVCPDCRGTGRTAVSQEPLPPDWDAEDDEP